MIVNSMALVLSGSWGTDATADNPVIGYQQLVTVSNVSTTTADADYPATNLANNSTALRWQGVVSAPEVDEYITLALNTVDDIDYVGIARHNFGTAQIAVSLEIMTDDSPETWAVLVEEFLPADDAPIVMRFELQAVTSVRVRLRPGTAAPRAAVVYAGALLVLQRRIYVGHTPMTMARSARVVNGRSESGDFLGRVVLSEATSAKIELSNLTPTWVRSDLLPFIRAGVEDPFFFAWRPGTYPLEVGFAWLTGDPQPSNSAPNGMMSVNLDMAGVV